MRKFDVNIEWTPVQVSIKIKGTCDDVRQLHREAGDGLEGAEGMATMEFILDDIELHQITKTPGPPSRKWFKKWFGEK